MLGIAKNNSLKVVNYKEYMQKFDGEQLVKEQKQAQEFIKGMKQKK